MNDMWRCISLQAVSGLSSECETELMKRFNGQNFLPFDAFSDHLLHREALQTTLKVQCFHFL